MGDRIVRRLVRPMEDGEWDQYPADPDATVSDLPFVVDVPPHLQNVGVMSIESQNTDEHPATPNSDVPTTPVLTASIV